MDATLTSTLSRAADLHRQGDLVGAAAAYQAVLSAMPGHARLTTQLGIIRLQQGRPLEAAPLFTQAILAEPTAPEPHAWYGELKRREGSYEDARASLQRAVDLGPGYAPAWFNLGLANAQSLRPQEAKVAWLKFLELRPADLRVRRELGVLAFDRREFSEALDWFQQQLVLTSEDSGVRWDLAATHLRLRQWQDALSVLDCADPEADSARVALLRGQALFGLGRFAEALPRFALAHSLDPTNIDAAYELGLVHDRLANLESAIQAYHSALSLAPDRANIVAALAIAELNLGRVEEAISHHRRAVDLDPKSAHLHSALLMALHYAEPDHARIFAEHQLWAARHAAASPTPMGSFRNGRSPQRKLRIGYLSPRFGRGPLAHFFLPVLRAHDRDEVEILCYMTEEHSDAITAQMRGLSGAWREVASATDAELLDIIRADGVDILVDMAGHCPGNRLTVFAQRAAPIQVSWLDYDDTTGVPAVDVYVSDAYLTPPDGRQRFTETLACPGPVRAPHGHVAVVPDAGALPFLRRGHITFGCINRLSKLGPAVVATWASILRGIPSARLLLQATAFASEEPKDVVRRRFSRHGIAADRLDLRPFTDEATMLRVYQEIDIALDPFPYNGCNTTCDALSMGVPVVTIEGTTLSGRHGFALLNSCGLTSWITDTKEAYIERALSAAANIEELTELRAQLPRRFLAAPICDAVRFTAALERTYRQLWQSWCGQMGPAPDEAGRPG